VDALGVLLLVLAMVAWARGGRGRAALAGLLAGMSALVKPLAPVLLPSLLRGRERRTAGVFLAGGIVAGLFALPYLAAGARLFTGFAAYAEHWRFHDAFYTPLVAAGLGPREARAVLAAALVAAAIVAPWRLRDGLAAAAVVVFAGVLLSPTVHPWYALWLVPLLPFLPRFAVPAGFGLVALLPLAYAAAWTRAATGEWAEPVWARIATWAPVLLLLGAGIVRALRARPAQGLGEDRRQDLV
jgi:hypothetical protein